MVKYVLLLRKHCCKCDDNYTATTAGKQYVRSYVRIKFNNVRF